MEDTSARIVAVGNLKGGTGKSTVSVNVACALATEGRRVAVVDTDPQATATRWASRGTLPAACESMPVRDFAQAGEWLDRLRDLRAAYDVLVIDLPAVLSPALASAFMVADLILIPTSNSEVDVFATVRTLKYVRNAREERPGNPPETLIVPSGVVRPWWDGRGFEVEFARLREAVAPPVRLRPELSAAFAAFDWVGGHAPRSGGHKDILAVKDAVVAALGRARAMAPAARRPAEVSEAEASARAYLDRRAERSRGLRGWWQRAPSS